MLAKTLTIPWQVRVDLGEPRTASKASKAQDSARNIHLPSSSREVPVVGVDTVDNSNSTLGKVVVWVHLHCPLHVFRNAALYVRTNPMQVILVPRNLAVRVDACIVVSFNMDQ